MDDRAAATLAFPTKNILFNYCTRAFQALEDGIDAYPVERFDDIIERVAFQLSHTSRHLGMIEALRGAQGLQGTATN